MKPINVLQKLNLICWPTLLVGLQRGWISKEVIADYATQLLSDDLDNGDENIAILASANFYDDAEVKELILQVINKLNVDLVSAQANAIEKWRLARLSELDASELSEEKKIDKLQEIYADFNYPEDMSACSIYAKDEIDPLIAMREVISSLKEKFGA